MLLNERGVFPGDHNRTPICRIETLFRERFDQRDPSSYKLGPNFPLQTPSAMPNKQSYPFLRIEIRSSRSCVCDGLVLGIRPLKQQVCYLPRPGLEYYAL